MIGKEGWRWAIDWATVNLRGGVRTSCASSPVGQWGPHKFSLSHCCVKMKDNTSAINCEKEESYGTVCVLLVSFLHYVSLSLATCRDR